MRFWLDQRMDESKAWMRPFPRVTGPSLAAEASEATLPRSGKPGSWHFAPGRKARKLWPTNSACVGPRCTTGRTSYWAAARVKVVVASVTQPRAEYVKHWQAG